MFTATILTENTARKKGFLAEHGLSIWLEIDDSRILFDAGQTYVYLHNAANLGIDITTADYIVISHGHYDHGNGLMLHPATKTGIWPTLYAHPDVFRKRFSRKQEQDIPHPVGLEFQPSDLTGFQRQLKYNYELIPLSDQTALVCRIANNFQKNQPTSNLFIERDGLLQPDPFIDEQVLVTRRAGGLIIVFGCCHPGLVSCLQRIQQLYPGEGIHAIIGGLHTENIPRPELEQIAGLLVDLNVNFIVPLHCSGATARCYLREVLGEKCLNLQAGDSVTFE